MTELSSESPFIPKDHNLQTSKTKQHFENLIAN